MVCSYFVHGYEVIEDDIGKRFTRLALMLIEAVNLLCSNSDVQLCNNISVYSERKDI